MIHRNCLLRKVGVVMCLLTIKISFAQNSAQNFFSLYNQLSQKNLIVNKNATSNNTYIQVETASSLCQNNGTPITHMDQLMPLIAHSLQPKRRGLAYYIDTEDSSLNPDGIIIRVRVLQKKNNPHLDLSSTIKFSSGTSLLPLEYQQRLLSLNPSTLTWKNELGLSLYEDNNLQNFQLSVTHNNIRHFLPSFMQTINIPQQFFTYRSHAKNFISFASLSSNLPLSSEQTWFFNQALEKTCHADIMPYSENLGIRAGMELSHWEKNLGSDTFIELDIEERKLFFPQNHTPYYVVSYKVKAQKNMEQLDQNLTKLLERAVAYASGGQLKSCVFPENFETYLYAEK
ncbi:MAG TPA: hypothetical protein PKC21_03440 [Oligoflexia bacterium]|nr:hypothetical protein [Oligoflexia bacterium]HMR24389.1 hypothetical protein [Oligoflexia bacterium]